MDVIRTLSDARHEPITSVEMHTTGEPTRIIIKGHPDLSGTLLEQRAQAKAQYDHIRRRLMLEPRGHFDMYGALLRPTTELTKSGEAHMGVLFMTNDGYSTMCGHATIALGRFLVDTHDLSIFPARDKIQRDQKTNTAQVNLHAPCGLVEITVPTLPDGSASDPSRPVSFVSVDSFTTGVNVNLQLAPKFRWSELGSQTHITADFAYGGAFYCFVPATELGFRNGLRQVDHEAMNKATKLLKASVNSDPQLRYLFRHPEHNDLSFLYSVIVVDDTLGEKAPETLGAETGLCFFSNQQVDRSPTGSAVSARIALACAKDKLKPGQSWTYHSLLSAAGDVRGAFVGSALAEEEPTQQQNGTNGAKFPIMKTRVEGYAYYVGYNTLVVEKEDTLGAGGFVFSELGQ